MVQLGEQLSANNNQAKERLINANHRQQQRKT